MKPAGRKNIFGVRRRRTEMEDFMKYEITVGEVKTENSNIKGYASLVFGDSFKVSNITILANRDNQMYISMPHYAKAGMGRGKISATRPQRSSVKSWRQIFSLHWRIYSRQNRINTL